jgi:hypothetical protein
MTKEKEAGQQEAPASQRDATFGMNEEDFYVDEATGTVFIGDTAVAGRGKRPPDPNMMNQPVRNLDPQPSEEIALKDEDFKMDDKGNLDIAGVRVQEEGIDNRDPIQDEFERARLTGDELEARRAEQEEQLRKEQEGKEPPPPPPAEEWTLKVADEERTIKDKDELLRLAQKGLGADYKFQEIANMRKEIEPFYEISLRLKDDPAFVEHVKSFGQPNYQVDGPEPVSVAPDQFQKLVEERVENQMMAQKIYWAHDAKYKDFQEYPKSDEVRQKLLSDSLHWDKFTRDWVDKNPVAYADKFNQTAQKLIREKMLDLEPARPIPQKVIEKQKEVLEKLRAKEVAKEKAKVESAKSTAQSNAEDGRLALNKARKRAVESGSISDWADVIAKMGLAD